MIRPSLVLVTAAAAAAGAVPARAAAQAETCFVMVDSTGGVGRQVDVGGGFVRWYQGGGMWAHCRREATRWYADSVAWYQEVERFDMVGSVDFADSTVHLTADHASYFLADERLEARGNAVLTNLKTGSVMRGPTLSYRRAVPGVRDTTDWSATGRPTIEYRSEEDTAGAEPYVIVADRVALRGGSAASAAGVVTIDRSDFTARSDSATLDTEAGHGTLIGHARVGGGEGSYTLDGRTIAYRLTDRAVTWVQAQGRADATSVEWRMIADTIQFDVLHNQIQRGDAWGSDTRPQAISLRQTITADSLAIEVPGQQLSEVRAFGTARAVSKIDSLDTEGDWVAGDTVIARFDSTGTGTRALTQVDALGSARAQYRIYPADNRFAQPDISYSRGDRITASFVNDAIARVDIVGRSDGVYLEAPRKRPP